ncbi:MAG TPA: penicillin-binding protein 2 [Stellaceae bacterium]|nr:penicillin-binding protein 2 [Stellaceae bacterium]
MQRENKRTKLLTRRAAIIGGAKVGLLGALAGRLYYLQVMQADRYAMLADENRINLRLLAPPRGLITDRFGVAMASNRQNYRVVLVAEQAGDIDSTLDAVGALITLSETDRRRVLREIRRKHSFVPVVVRENLSWDEMARIEVNAPELPGVSIEQGLTRHYPFGEMASHVVGYVAAVSEKELTGDPLLELPDFRIGKNGAEKTHDLALRGKAGTSQVEVNAFGRVVRELSREEGTPGQEVTLTIDAELQQFAAQRCVSEGSVACVVMDAPTGEVLAMVAVPGYDPAAFAAGLTSAMWRELTENPFNPLTNKTISGVYAPGSTFKPMVALAALDAGVATPESRVSCPGHFDLGNTVFHCWKKGGHGSLDMHGGIKNSCDVYFYEMARRLGIDRIAAMAQRFGFGAPLGIDVPDEKGGLIPTRDWKFSRFGIPWQPGETISCGIGQGYITATPLQLATMVCRLVTNRVVVPRLTRTAGVMTADQDLAALASFGTLNVAPRDLQVVLDGMNAVVNEPGGTAYSARIKDPALAMGGKSGTAQVRHITLAEREHGLPKIKDTPWKERDHALFVSFAPVSAPRYVCAVVVEHGGESAGGGSAVAAPICADVLVEAQKRDPARRVPDSRIATDRVMQRG